MRHVEFKGPGSSSPEPLLGLMGNGRKWERLDHMGTAYGIDSRDVTLKAYFCLYNQYFRFYQSNLFLWCGISKYL